MCAEVCAATRLTRPEVAFLLCFWYRGIIEQKVYEYERIARLSLVGKGLPRVMIRLLMQWDIKMGREQDFSEFVVREFAPRLMQLGIEPNEVLYTMYGEGPQMLTIGAVESREKLVDILQSAGWKKLHDKLLTYVTNYSQKVVPDNGRNFQL
jgi:hypothetical protein